MSHRGFRSASLTLACLLLAAPAAAETKKIPPLAFKPVESSYDAVYSPFWVGADVNGADPIAYFAAPLKLPKNATIDAATCYFTAAAGAHLTLLLAYLDTASPSTNIQVIAAGTNAGDSAVPAPLALNFTPGADLTVRPGYRYLLMAIAAKQAFLWEARVAFTR